MQQALRRAQEAEEALEEAKVTTSAPLVCPPPAPFLCDRELTCSAVPPLPHSQANGLEGGGRSPVKRGNTMKIDMGDIDADLRRAEIQLKSLEGEHQEKRTRYEELMEKIAATRSDIEELDACIKASQLFGRLSQRERERESGMDREKRERSPRIWKLILRRRCLCL